MLVDDDVVLDIVIDLFGIFFVDFKKWIIKK